MKMLCVQSQENDIKKIWVSSEDGEAKPPQSPIGNDFGKNRNVKSRLSQKCSKGLITKLLYYYRNFA
jgi:hypothetical protein